MKRTHYYFQQTPDNTSHIVYAVLAEDANNDLQVAEAMARRTAQKRKAKLAGGWFTLDIYDANTLTGLTIIKVYKNTKPYYPQPDKRQREAIFTWDDTEVIDEELNIRRGDEVYEGQSDEEITEDIYIDAEFWERVAEDKQDELTQIMDKKRNTGYWKANGTNMGWTHADGFKYFKADTGKELLDAVLPKTDCTVRVYRQPRGFEMIVSHHDAPTGERYFIRPIEERTYDRENF